MKARVLMVALLITAFAGVAQAGEVDEFIDLLRTDLREDKEELVDQAMGLRAEDAAKFWDIYKEYEKDLAMIGDRYVEMLEEFPDAWAMTGPTTIRTLSAEWLKMQDDKTKLVKKYFKKVEKECSPRIAARWMQIEHRIGLLIDLQLAADTPLIDRVPR